MHKKNTGWISVLRSSSRSNATHSIGELKNPVRNRLKIQFVKLDFSKFIFQKSSADQQGEWNFFDNSFSRYCLIFILTFMGSCNNQFLKCKAWNFTKVLSLFWSVQRVLLSWVISGWWATGSNYWATLHWLTKNQNKRP